MANPIHSTRTLQKSQSLEGARRQNGSLCLTEAGTCSSMAARGARARPASSRPTGSASADAACDREFRQRANAPRAQADGFVTLPDTDGASVCTRWIRHNGSISPSSDSSQHKTRQQACRQAFVHHLLHPTFFGQALPARRRDVEVQGASTGKAQRRCRGRSRSWSQLSRCLRGPACGAYPRSV